MLDAPLIIFDCDGVLVDSEPVTNRILAQTVTELGHPIDSAYSIAHFKGRAMCEIERDIEALLGRPVPDFLPIYRERMYHELTTEPVPPIPGVVDLLDHLDTLDNHTRCVATNGPTEKATLTLSAAALTGRFAHPADPDRTALYSAYEIQRWKPDPALFLHAASDLGFGPEDCVVIEDSPSGVAAARGAQMRVIGLSSLTPRGTLEDAGATIVVDSLSELADRTR